MNKPLYQLREITKVYENRAVLSIPFLEIMRGEILAVVGPSGSGKSTLLRLLNFLEAPNTGTIQFDGQQIGKALPIETARRVTTVFQQPILLKRSVAANIEYGLKLRGQKLEVSVLDYWLDRLGLPELRDQKGSKLSAGEAQRVSLARALALRPEVLLLDEPTANLDPYNVGLIEKIVREENGKHGMTVVLVTHNIFQAKRLADRTALLLGGDLVETAVSHQFFTSPADKRTAAFVQGKIVY